MHASSKPSWKLEEAKVANGQWACRHQHNSIILLPSPSTVCLLMSQSGCMHGAIAVVVSLLDYCNSLLTALTGNYSPYNTCETQQHSSCLVCKHNIITNHHHTHTELIQPHCMAFYSLVDVSCDAPRGGRCPISYLAATYEYTTPCLCTKLSLSTEHSEPTQPLGQLSLSSSWAR